WLTTTVDRSQKATKAWSVLGTGLPVFISGEIAHLNLLIHDEVETSTFLFPATSAKVVFLPRKAWVLAFSIMDLIGFSLLGLTSSEPICFAFAGLCLDALMSLFGVS